MFAMQRGYHLLALSTDISAYILLGILPDSTSSPTPICIWNKSSPHELARWHNLTLRVGTVNFDMYVHRRYFMQFTFAFAVLFK